MRDLCGHWVTHELLDLADGADTGEGLIRFTFGGEWTTYQIADYDLARDTYLLGRVVARSAGLEETG